MSAQSIGVTAMELFACNPYRVLGVAVNAPHSEITEKYKTLFDMAVNGTADSYRSPFDFDSLPPFSRSADSLKTAYAKLASNGYRCFAFSDSIFTEALNIDDVYLNIRDITCYDCFLRCYMWLIVNDRAMEEEELWIDLAKYIDKMIASGADQYARYFDNRFPADMADQNSYESFHTTFCEIILLPIKEMVRGSMRCTSALDILKIKGIDVDQTFEDIDIPQANKPKPGEPAPKLKIALKDGDEYFDISTGKMMSFESDTSADVESNIFAQAAAPITAAAIISEPEEEAAAETYAEPAYDAYEEASQPAPSYESYSGTPQPAPVQPQPARTAPAPAPVQNTVAPQLKRKPSSVFDDTASYTESAPSPAMTLQTAPQMRKKAPVSQTVDEQPVQQSAPKLMRKSTSLVDDSYMSASQSSSEVNLTEDAQEEENLYTDALIQMLRANRSRNQMMKDVDTKHVFHNGGGGADALGEAAPAPELSMEGINMNKYDSSLLASPYAVEYGTGPITREERYKDVKIDDMLNPTLGNKMQRTAYQPDAIEEFKKNKQEKKKAIMTLIKTGIFIAVFVVGIILLNASGIL